MPPVWRNVKVSNPTPYPYEKITISGELWWSTWPFPDRPAVGVEVTLTIDEYVLGKVKTGKGGLFSFTIGAPGVPGPYTYVLRRGEALPRYYVSIDVIPPPPPEPNKRKRYLLLGVIGLEMAGLVWLLKGR